MSNTRRTQEGPVIALHPVSAVCAMTDLSRSTIYRLIAQGEFPKPIKISPGRVAWSESDLVDWLNERGRNDTH